MLSADDIARITAEIEGFKIQLARPLASAKQTSMADVYRAATDGSGMQLHTMDILLHIAAPSPQGLQILADLGGGRASVLAELPFDADVTEGDELHIGDTVYLVERAAKRVDLLLCALSEEQP